MKPALMSSHVLWDCDAQNGSIYVMINVLGEPGHSYGITVCLMVLTQQIIFPYFPWPSRHKI